MDISFHLISSHFISSQRDSSTLVLDFRKNNTAFTNPFDDKSIQSTYLSLLNAVLFFPKSSNKVDLSLFDSFLLDFAKNNTASTNLFDANLFKVHICLF